MSCSARWRNWQTASDEMDDLLYGTYTLKETVAPEGFYLDTNTYTFSITENGKTVIVENEAGKGFINDAQVGAIRIEKTSEDGVLQASPSMWKERISPGMYSAMTMSPMRTADQDRRPAHRRLCDF